MLGADADAWDRFVSSVASGSFPQLTAWAEANAANGWESERVVVDGVSGPIGAQVLVHRMPGPWSRGSAPRGPVAAAFPHEDVEAFTAALRRAAARRRLSHVVVDPLVEDGHPLARSLAAAGWSPTDPVAINRTRIVDLDASEEELWSAMRSKWRQYVTKGRREGLTIVEEGAHALDAFVALYTETAHRVGFDARAVRRVYSAFASRGAARLLLARVPEGHAVAGVMLVDCGPRVVEVYGGITTEGGERRANYLLKWEAIRRSREAGFLLYDMWGADDPGIAHFKAGFGGREVTYVGAWEFVTSRPGRLWARGGQRLRSLASRARRRRESSG